MLTPDAIFGGLLRLIGAFYALGGVVVLWSSLTAVVAQQAQVAIEGRSQLAAAVWRGRWLVGAALVLLFCGLALALRVDLALPLFGLSWLGQALYLGLLAPRWFDAVDGPQDAGRQANRNAFWVFSVATALVVLAWTAGILQPWRAVSQTLLASALAASLFAIAYAVINLRPPR